MRKSSFSSVRAWDNLRAKQLRTINPARRWSNVTLLRHLVMHKDPRTPSFCQLIVHAAMGGILGALLMLVLIVTNRHFFELIAHSPSPTFLLAQFMVVGSFLIAAGATVSGFFFTAIEINTPPAKERAIRPPDKRRDLGE